MATRTVGRIQTRAAFGQLRRSGARASCGPVRAAFVPVAPGVRGVYPQVGYAIGRRCGHAVARNTLRRRLREATRDVAGSLPRGIYLVRLEPAAATTDPAQLTTFVQQALQRAGQAAGEV